MRSPTLRALRSVALWASVASIFAVVGCGSHDATAPGSTGTPGGGRSVALAVGASANLTNATALSISEPTGGEFVLVVSDTLTTASGTPALAYQVSVTGIAAPGSVSAPATTQSPSTLRAALEPSAGAPSLDLSYGTRLNASAASRLRPLFSAIHARGVGSRSGSLRDRASAPPQVGDLLSYNVGARACDSVVIHPARVVAVGSKALVVVDTLDPPGGFVTADYQRFAATFDTLVYSLDVANFGAPTDIDANGHVVLLFTRAVNELTTRNSDSYVGGFFFARDLFPTTAAVAADACAGSNDAEMFYLLAPDPTGLVNGNVRTAGFVDSLTTSLIAHEFQHLINGSRRIYVNNADDFEVVWLNEGLSHIAEELLFYHQSGLGPRQNIDAPALRATRAAVDAFNADQGANASRYGLFLAAPSKSSPIRNDDSLSTRGATWDLLRYAADKKVQGASSGEATVWQALVNSTTSGVTNLRAVFGPDLGALLRDWSVSQYADDATAGASTTFSQPSWNWHSIFAALGSRGGSFPLPASPLTASGVSGSVIAGGSAYYRFAVPVGGSSSITLTAGAGASPVSGVVLRIR
jgi:hypothetical protein